MAQTLNPSAQAMAAVAAHPTGSHLVLVGLCLVLALMRGASLMGDAQAATNAQAPQHSPEQTYQLALEARTERDYPAMLALLREAGSAGDVRAQELLGSVLLAGPTLYGASIQSDVCEAASWSRRAAGQGSEVARHQLNVLNGLRNTAGGAMAQCEAPH